jgi:thioredoxin 1
MILFPLALVGNTFDENTLPKPDTVTMIDLGAKSCIPCKMMAPILEKLELEYRGKADVVFIDVRENTAAGKKYGVRSIPTQIFYNKKGKEVWRHVGFLDEKSIRDYLEKLLVE